MVESIDSVLLWYAGVSGGRIADKEAIVCQGGA